MARDDQPHDDGAAGQGDRRQRFRARAQEAYGRVDPLGPVAEIHAARSTGTVRERWRERVALWTSRPIEFIPQIGYADCGAAALSMALRSMGVDVDETTVRSRVLLSRDGTSVSLLGRAAQSLGVGARGVRASIDGLRSLRRGTILHWRFNHYVVLERMLPTGAVVVDPAVGRRLVPFTELDESFTGIALELHPLEGTTVGRPRRDHRTVLRTFIPRTRLWWAALGLSGLLIAFTLLLPLAIELLVDSASIEDLGESGWAIVGIVALAVVAFGVLQVLRSRVIVLVQSLFERDSTRTLFLRLIRLPYRFFGPRHPAELAQRLRTASRLRDMVSVPTLGAFFDAALVVVYIVGIALRDPVLALVVLALVVLMAVVVLATWRRQAVLAADVLDAQVRSVSTMQEVLEEIATVKSLGAEAAAEARWQAAFSREIGNRARHERYASAVTAVLATVQFGAPLVLIAAGVLQAASGTLQLGQVLAIATLAAALFASLGTLSDTIIQLTTLGPEFARIRDLLAHEPEPSGMHVDGREVRIEVRDVGFTYPGAKQPALHDVALVADPGDYVGVLGASGSGKSTLAMILGAIERPTFGEYRMNGVVVADEHAASMRSRIGYVNQNARLMSGSIIDNVRLGKPDADLDEVERAIYLAGAEEFVAQMPMSLETMVGAGGAGLSGGQRQRIALARALVRQPSLLLLDEATNAIDPDTEQMVLQNIRGLDVTLVVFGHRLNLVREADRIYVVDDGTISAVGTPTEIARLRERGDLIL